MSITSVRPRRRGPDHPHLGVRATAAIQTTRDEVPLCRWRDGVYTRVTNATHVNPSTGLVRTVGQDVLREERIAGSRLTGILLERSTKNSVLHSEELDDAVWTATNASVASGVNVGPAGGYGISQADRLTRNAAGGNIAQVLASGFLVGAMSVYVKAGTQGAGYGFEVVGQVQAEGPQPPLWTRARLRVPGVPVNPTVKIYPETIVAGPGGANGDNAIFWGVQAENNRYVTSYIPTAGTTGNRSSCTHVMPVSRVPTQLLSGAWRMLVQPCYGSDELVDGDKRWLLSFSSGNLKIARAAGVVSLEARCGGGDSSPVVASVSPTWSAGQALLLDVDPPNGSLRVSVVGTNASFESAGGVRWRWSHGSRDTMVVGGDLIDDIGREFDGLIGDPYPAGAALI